MKDKVPDNFKRIVYEDDDDKMPAVDEVEFYELGEVNRTEAVDLLMDQIGGETSIHIDGLGMVAVDGSGIGQILSHRNEKRKASLIGAIIPTLKKGKLVAVDTQHKGRTYNTATVVAPITFTNSYGKTEAGDYYVAVTIKRSPTDNVSNQGLHVVDILTKKKGVRDSGSVDINQQSDASNLSLYSILEHVAADVNIYKASNEEFHFSLNVDSTGKELSEGQQE